MASIHFKKSASGEKVYYLVVSYRGKHKWIRAGNLNEARDLKKKIESMENSQRLEKLGLAPFDKRIDELFQEYADYVRFRSSANTVKRYLSVLNTFPVSCPRIILHN
jgi:hypothetical protein